MLRFLSLILVCLSSMCLSGSAQAASSAGLNRDYGVKLCGREFIRAVIFTCGGSRWKRSGDEDPLDSSDDPFVARSYVDLSNTESRLSWPGGLALQRPDKPASTLADLLKVLRDPASGAAVDFSEREQVGGWQSELSQAQNDVNAVWSRPSRRKRNFSLGLAGMCCHQGCTKNDIGRLC